MSQFELILVASNGIKFKGFVESCYIKTPLGEIGILPKHEDIVTLVEPGEVVLDKGKPSEKHLAVDRGILKCSNNSVILLVEEVFS